MHVKEKTSWYFSGKLFSEGRVTEMTKFDQALEYAIQEIGNWKYKNCIEKIYLYGSCARSEQKPDSDIDLYIELGIEVPEEEIRNLKIQCNPDDWKLPDVDMKFDIHNSVLEKDDLFHKNIRNEGILLWEKK